MDQTLSSALHENGWTDRWQKRGKQPQLGALLCVERRRRTFANRWLENGSPVRQLAAGSPPISGPTSVSC